MTAHPTHTSTFAPASGPACLALSYVCSTGGRLLDAVRCGSLEQARHTPPTRASSRRAEPSHSAHPCFVEQGTGDYLVYAERTRAWFPCGSTGVFKLSGAATTSRPSARGSGADGTHAPAPASPRRRVYVDRGCAGGPKGNEVMGPQKGHSTVCHIQPEVVQHEVFAGVQSGFLVECDSDWALDAGSNKRCRHQYRVLASNEYSPTVVALRNAWGLLFHLNAEYVTSLRIARNFAERAFGHSFQGCGAAVAADLGKKRLAVFEGHRVLSGPGSSLAPKAEDSNATSVRKAAERGSEGGFSTARGALAVAVVASAHDSARRSESPERATRRLDPLWAELNAYMRKHGNWRALEVFKAMDTDGSGLLDTSELQAATLQMLGKRVSRGHLQALIAEATLLVRDADDAAAQRKRAAGAAPLDVDGLALATHVPNLAGPGDAPGEEPKLPYKALLAALRAEYRDGRHEHESTGRSSKADRGSGPADRSFRLQGLAQKLGVALPQYSGRREGEDSDYEDEAGQDDDVPLTSRSAPGSASPSRATVPGLPQLPLGGLLRTWDGEGPSAPSLSQSARVVVSPAPAHATAESSRGPQASSARDGRKQQRVRVKPASADRPYSTYGKYVQMRNQERPARQYTNKQWEGYHSVVVDGAPYYDKFTKKLMEEKESKKKWVDQAGFVVHGGGELKLREDYGIVASGPYGPQLRGPHDDSDPGKWVGPRWGTIGDRQNATGATGAPGGAPDLAVKVGRRDLPLRRRSHSAAAAAKLPGY